MGILSYLAHLRDHANGSVVMAREVTPRRIRVGLKIQPTFLRRRQPRGPIPVNTRLLYQAVAAHQQSPLRLTERILAAIAAKKPLRGAGYDMTHACSPW